MPWKVSQLIQIEWENEVTALGPVFLDDALEACIWAVLSSDHLSDYDPKSGNDDEVDM
jgi:hypothetical protein